MTLLIIVAACLLLAYVSLELKKAYFALPTYELKRRAAAGDQFSRRIYPVVAHPSLRGLLWLSVTVPSAVGLILFAGRYGSLWGIIVTLIWLWLIYSWLPNRNANEFSNYLAKLCVPCFMWFFGWANPALKPLEKIQGRYQEPHTKLYENEDLRRFLHHQSRQADNRISNNQLMRINKLVSYDAATVGNFARTWKKSLKLVDSDNIGPKLLDELHRSKQHAFLVTNHKNSRHIVGVLSRDTVGLETQGRVSDYMRKEVESIGRDEPIEQALLRFAQSSSPLLVVIDKENEAVGTLSLSDALDALLVLDEVKPEKSKPTEEVETKEEEKDKAETE